MNTYIILHTEDNADAKATYLTKADSKEEARLKYAKSIGITDNVFIDYVYGELSYDIYVLTGQDDDDDAEYTKVCDDKFNANVHTYFGSHDTFACLFIEYFKKENSPKNFPEEMLLYIWLKEMEGGSWMSLAIMELNEITKI